MLQGDQVVEEEFDHDDIDEVGLLVCIMIHVIAKLWFRYLMTRHIHRWCLTGEHLASTIVELELSVQCQSFVASYSYAYYYIICFVMFFIGWIFNWLNTISKLSFKIPCASKDMSITFLPCTSTQWCQMIFIYLTGILLPRYRSTPKPWHRKYQRGVSFPYSQFIWLHSPDVCPLKNAADLKKLKQSGICTVKVQSIQGLLTRSLA